MATKWGEMWILEGDSNSKFFHLANGCRRRKKILSLEHEGETVTNPTQIQSTIYSFYKRLFGSQPPSTLRLGEEIWQNKYRLDRSDVEELTKPFTEEEVKRVVFDMKENTAPSPDGFSVTFYKHFWETIKGELMELIHDF